MSKRSRGSTHDRRPSRLRREEAMEIWRAREAYRVQTLWMTLCFMVFGFPLLIMVTSGHWGVACGIGGAWWLVQWALPRGLRRLYWSLQDGARWAGRWSLRKAWRWGRSLGAVLMLGTLLTGCQGVDCWIAGMHGFKGDPATGMCMHNQPAPKTAEGR